VGVPPTTSGVVHEWKQALEDAQHSLSRFVLVGAMDLALGLINLLMVHGGKVLYRRKGWGPSIALLTGLVAMMVITSLDWKETRAISASVQRVVLLKDFADRIVTDQAQGIVPEVRGKKLPAEERENYLEEALASLVGELRQEQRELSVIVPAEARTPREIASTRFYREFSGSLDEAARLLGDAQGRSGAFDPAPLKQLSQALSALSVSYRGLKTSAYGTALTKRFYDFLFEGLFISLGAAMFSLLGFYISAAAYRAFRGKSMESVLMMTAALFVMLGQIPFGLWISDALPEIRLWLLQVPSGCHDQRIAFGADDRRWSADWR
jgi:hypothetical protein